MKKDVCLFLVHERPLVYFFFLCPYFVWYVCVHVFHSCVPPAVVTKQVLLWGKSNLCKHVLVVGGDLELTWKKSSSILARFFSFFVSVGSYKRTCQGCKCLEGYISSSYAVVCSETIHSILEYSGATLVMQSHHSILLHKNALWPLTHHQSPRTRLNLWKTQLLQKFLYTVWVVPAGICPIRVVTARAWLRIGILRERSGGFCVAGIVWKCGWTGSWHQKAMGTVEQLGRYGGLFCLISCAGKCVHVTSFRLQTIPGSTHHQMIVNPVHSKWILCVYSSTCQSLMNGQNGVCSFIVHNGCHTGVTRSCSAVKTHLEKKPTPKLSTPLPPLHVCIGSLFAKCTHETSI